MKTIETATHATASMQFGQIDTDQHKIHVTTYFGSDDEAGQHKIIEVSNVEWDAANGDSTNEKIESILGWWGTTEHDGEYVHVFFE